MGRKTRIRGIEVGARCLVSRGDHLLFQYDSKYDYYRFPGGHTEYYESITHCAMREMREELGVEASPKRIVYINENMYMVRNRLRHELVFYYDCTIRGEPVPLEEKVKVVWARPEEVLNKFRPRILLERIAEDWRIGFPKVYYILTFGNTVKILEPLAEGSLPLLLYRMSREEENTFQGNRGQSSTASQ